MKYLGIIMLILIACTLIYIISSTNDNIFNKYIYNFNSK